MLNGGGTQLSGGRGGGEKKKGGQGKSRQYDGSSSKKNPSYQFFLGTEKATFGKTSCGPDDGDVVKTETEELLQSS